MTLLLVVMADEMIFHWHEIPKLELLITSAIIPHHRSSSPKVPYQYSTASSLLNDTIHCLGNVSRLGVVKEVGSRKWRRGETAIAYHVAGCTKCLGFGTGD